MRHQAHRLVMPGAITQKASRSGVLGVLGVGAIAEAIVVGLCSQADAPPMVLSPRGHGRATRLAARFGSVWVADGNQAVLDAADTVLVCVRPTQATEALADLRWREDHSAISAMAGVPVDDLRALVAPATDVARVIPLPSVSTGATSTPVHPANPAAEWLFDQVGGAVVVEDEGAFEAMSAVTGTIAHHLQSLEAMARWEADHGVEQSVAARHVASMYAALGLQLSVIHPDLAATAAEHATTGGLNERFAASMRRAGALDALRDSLDDVLGALRRT